MQQPSWANLHHGRGVEGGRGRAFPRNLKWVRVGNWRQQALWTRPSAFPVLSFNDVWLLPSSDPLTLADSVIAALHKLKCAKTTEKWRRGSKKKEQVWGVHRLSQILKEEIQIRDVTRQGGCWMGLVAVEQVGDTEFSPGLLLSGLLGSLLFLTPQQYSRLEK